MKKGFKISEKIKQKMRLNHKGMLGKKHLEETKQKISEKMKGRHWKMSEQGKINITLARMGRKLSEEHKRNIGLAHRGLKCNFWKGGITKLYDLIRTSFKYRQWRSDIFTHNNFTCQKCGDNKGGNLEAHHIKSFALILKEYQIKTLEQAEQCEELWNINNGQTLCIECHKKTKNYAGKGLKRTKTCLV